MAVHMPGGFILDALIERGGTAEVWRATHLGRPIAVKVLTTERARHPRYHRLFRNEVRAAAGLNHPGVLTVLDHGEMLAPDPRAGCPWLAMELADGGTLLERCGKLPWSEARGLVLQLLSALGYAHARGIIHRDIKPRNALFVGEVLKLSDFGLAWSGVEDGIDRIVGTPAYMAPEQFEGHWREFGPWTDLYAVGCLVWQLVCGAPPFVADRVALLAAAHLSWPVPSLRPAIPVPSGLSAWLGRLLEKRPAERFQRAADAAWALEHLGAPSSAVFPLQQAGDDETTITTEITLPARTRLRQSPASRIDFPLPPMPADWRQQESPDPPVLPGAGMSLYGLRTIPLCGRIEERDALWRAMLTVHTTRRPKMVVLQGNSGTGKSRLAQWLCVSAHASGAADYVQALHSPAGGRAEGLVAMLLRATGCESLSPIDARDRLIEKLRGALQPDDLAALLDLLTDTNTPTTAAERHALLSRWVAVAAQRRPLVLWLDDVAWGEDALTFAERLLDQSDLPVLLLLTAARPELAERPVERAHLDALIQRSDVMQLSVGRLSPREHAQLIEQILGLDPALARTLQSHTSGNPLFAVQLVGDWVASGALIEGPNGLRLSAGVPHLPVNLQEVWAHRLARLLEARTPDDARALELAAVLGDRVHAGEWRRVCLRAGCSPSPELVDALLEERLVTSPDPGQGWAFVHRLLRQSLLADIHTDGRWHAHHRSCAEALSDPERRGRHRLEAGEPTAAIPDLLTTARRALELGEVRRAQAALADWHRALSMLGADANDPRQGRGLAMEIDAHRRLGRFDAAAMLAEDAVARATLAWPGRPELLRAAGRTAHIQGNLPLARRHIEAALAQLTARPPDLTAARCHQILGQIFSDQGLSEDARAHYEAACALFEQLGDRAGLFSMYMTRCAIAMNAGRLSEARDFGEQALSLARERRQRTWLGDAWQYLGEVARRAEHYREAEVFYRRALSVSQSTGWVGGIQLNRMNIALVALERSAFDEAAQISAEIAAALESSGKRLLENLVLAIELGVAVGRGEQERAAALLSVLEDILTRSGLKDWDLGRLASLCAERTVGWPIQARLSAMARQQGYSRNDSSDSP